MPKRILEKLQRSILGGAIIIGSASIISRVLGLLRDRLLTTQFGAGDVLDAYFTAFKIPDFFFNIVVLGILSASFVPVFIEYKEKKGKNEAFAMANSVINLIAFVLIVFAVLCYVFAPQLVELLAYGDSIEQKILIVRYTRIMLGSLFFFGLSNVVAGILHAQKKFLAYAVAPIFYNIGIILGILVFVPLWGPIGLGYGVVLGAFFHFIVQLPAAVSAGFRYTPSTQWKHPGVIQILKLMPPRAFALGLTQLNILVIFSIASTLPSGDRAVWQFADNLQHFPINIFGVSLALAAFPVFSEAFAEDNVTKFKEVFSDNFRRILFYIIPISIATLLLRAQIVRLVYGAGEFDWQDTFLTAQTLGAFTLSMFAQALIPLLARSFFAKQDTKTPVIMSVIAMIVNIILAILLAPIAGIIGLAFAYSIAAILQMMLLLGALRVRHGDLDDDHIVNSAFKIIVAAVGMGLVIQGLKYAVEPLVDMTTFVGVFIQTGSAVVSGGLTYLIIASLFHFDEVDIVVGKMQSGIQLIKKHWQS